VVIDRLCARSIFLHTLRRDLRRQADNESCDFILADTVNRRVVLVHAKAWSDWRPFSASAVQEVCAQAQKNTALFSTYTLRKPDNFHLWDETHRFNGLSVAPRIRKSKYRDRNVCGQRSLRRCCTTRSPHVRSGLSWGTCYRRQPCSVIFKARTLSEVLQLNQLLQTTIAAAGSVSVSPRIFLCAVEQCLKSVDWLGKGRTFPGDRMKVPSKTGAANAGREGPTHAHCSF
jgi:hypothetical protein